ncbi:MAG: hypothetical protein ABI877_00930 [Gemmatimonadaceae bacterium]
MIGVAQFAARFFIVFALAVTIASVHFAAPHVVVTVAATVGVLIPAGLLLLVHRQHLRE